MNHIAILTKGVLPLIISGEKTIESRWYKNRIAPWNKIFKGDTIYFKESGGKVKAKAKVEKVIQIQGLNKKLFKDIIKKYNNHIKLKNPRYTEYYKNKNYVILIFLKDIKLLKRPFNIDKKGFGNACAWLCVKDINKIKRI